MVDGFLHLYDWLHIFEERECLSHLMDIDLIQTCKLYIKSRGRKTSLLLLINPAID